MKQISSQMYYQSLHYNSYLKKKKELPYYREFWLLCLKKENLTSMLLTSLILGILDLPTLLRDPRVKFTF